MLILAKIISNSCMSWFCQAMVVLYNLVHVIVLRSLLSVCIVNSLHLKAIHYNHIQTNHPCALETYPSYLFSQFSAWIDAWNSNDQSVICVIIITITIPIMITSPPSFSSSWIWWCTSLENSLKSSPKSLNYYTSKTSASAWYWHWHH